MVEWVLTRHLVEVGRAMATSRLGRLKGQEARVASYMLALGYRHITILDDGSSVLVKHMLLTKLAKCCTT